MSPAGEITPEVPTNDMIQYILDSDDPMAAPPHLPINIINFDDYNNHRWSTRTSNHEIVEVEDEEEEEEEEEEEDNDKERSRVFLASIKEEYNEIESIYDDRSSNLFSINGDNFQNADDVVYVAVWKGSEEQSAVSMEALVWTLNNSLRDSTIVYLVHVFPEIRCIPTPLGNLPINQANPVQKESFMIQERSKRREYLQKFFDLCSSTKVNVEAVLIESDMEAKAILDLIPILNIRKLVLGTTKSTLRKMKSSFKRNTVDQILHNVPEFCEVKIICDGKEVSVHDHLNMESPSRFSAAPSSSRERGIDVSSPKSMQAQQDHTNDFVRFFCLKPKVVS